MKSKQNISQLAEFYSTVSHPWGLAGDLLVARFPFLRFLNYFRRPAKPNIDLLKNGYGGYELGLWSHSLFDADWNIDTRQLKKIQKKQFPIHRFHACFEMLPTSLRGVHFNIASGESVNDQALIAQIDVAHELSGDKKTVLVVHPGFVKNSQRAQEGIEAIISVLRGVVSHAENKNVVIALENMPYSEQMYFIGSSIDELIEIVDRVDSPYVKITFDWGHLNISAFSSDVPDNFAFIDEELKRMGDRIVHAHLNYNKCCQKAWQPYVSKRKSFLRSISNAADPGSFDLIGLEQLDEHMPLIRAQGEYEAPFRKNLETLFAVSSILEYGYVTHEVEPKKIFSFFSHKPEGAETEDRIRDAEIVRDLVDKIK